MKKTRFTNFIFKILFMSFLILSAPLLFAEPTNAPSNPAGYCEGLDPLEDSKKKMCDCSADLMKKDDIKKLDIESATFANKLDLLAKKRKILTDLDALVKDYLKNLSILDKFRKRPMAVATVENYQRAVQDAILISSIQRFLDNPNLDLSNAGALDQFCKNKKEAEAFICSKLASDNSKEALIRFATSFKAFKNGDDQKKLIEAAKEILKGFDRIEDEKLIQYAVSLNKEDNNFRNCLPNENINVCLKANAAFFKSTLPIPVSSDENKSNQNFANTILSNYFNAFENRVPELGPVVIGLTPIAPAATVVLAPNAKVKSLNEIVTDALKNLTTLETEQDKNDKLKNFSSGIKQLSACKDQPQDQQKCENALTKYIKENLGQTINAVDDEIRALQNEFSNTINSNQNKRARILQDYIAQNFIRACDNKSAAIEIKPTVICKGLPEINALKLGKDTYNIVGNLSRASGITDATFSQAELAEILALCNEGTYANENRLVCKSAKENYHAAAGMKTDAEWEKLHEKYIIEYNDEDRRHYTVRERKTTTRLVGEAFFTGVTNTLPYAMYNYTQKINISMMADQAMMQKQWLYDMNQANTYWMDSYFNVPTPITFNSNNSFNFGN